MIFSLHIPIYSIVSATNGKSQKQHKIYTKYYRSSRIFLSYIIIFIIFFFSNQQPPSLDSTRSNYFFLFLSFLIGINLNLVFGRSARMGRACFCILNRACESHKIVLLRLATDSLLSYFLRQLQFIFVNFLDTC